MNCFYCEQPFAEFMQGNTVQVRENNRHILSVDHKHPRILGGTDDPANLAQACRLCNSVKSGRTVGEYVAHLLADIPYSAHYKEQC